MSQVSDGFIKDKNRLVRVRYTEINISYFQVYSIAEVVNRSCLIGFQKQEECNNLDFWKSVLA